MLRLILLIGYLCITLVKSITIEYPTSQSIEERQRTDIDSIFRYYLIQHEIQIHPNAIKDNLPYFLRCKGSKPSIQLTIPSSAENYLSLEKDDRMYTITARLTGKRLHSDLIGRYVCSEKINHKIQQAAIYIFIPNDRSVFTKKVYPTVFKETGVHFFNIPCQTTSWHPNISCGISSNSKKRGQSSCIPVSYKPANIKAEKIFFDPQIGFALVNPMISDGLKEFSCLAESIPSEQSTVPYDKSPPAFVQIYQQGFTVMQDEIVQLTCEIRYERRIYPKEPRIFWFEDIYGLQLISNQSKARLFNDQTKLFHQNSTLILQGFQPNQIYRFYCVRESDQRFYSRSVEITGVKEPSLDLTVDLSSTGTNDEIPHGSNGVYDIRVLTVPHSEIQISILRNGIPFSSDRYKLTLINNQDDRLWDYILTIFNMTFEDETDFNITAKASMAEKSMKIKPIIIGNPIGEFSFIPEQIPHVIPWRYENSKIYAYGISERESYRVVCNVRHRTDQKRSLNVFIEYHSCSVDDCLIDLADKRCRSSNNRNTMSVTSHRTEKFQSQFVSSNSHRLENPSMGYQYLCCYEQNGFMSVAKAMTVLSHNRTMFTVSKPEYGLVTGDSLTYRCEGHSMIYDDLRMIYKDGLLTYERSRMDKAWHLQGSRQRQQLDLNWNVPISKDIRSMAIEVKTPALTKNRNNAHFQCIAQSKRSDLISNAMDTYVINVEDQVTLEFKKPMNQISQINRRAGDRVELDCTFNGRPKPKILWLKGKSLLDMSQSTFLLENNNASLRTNRVQALDTGYYTCLLTNGRGKKLERYFNLRVEGTNPYSKFNRIIGPIIIISILLFLVMFITLLCFGVRYCRMMTDVRKGVYYENKPVGQEDQSQPALGQLARIPLPENFASQSQIHTFLDYVNGKSTPTDREDFKELGRGQFGVVYQVLLPDVGLVAAKILPENIRQAKHSRDKRKKSDDLDESEEMIGQHELRKKKAVEMLIDEIKVMHKAGKHVNIVALKKVAYPEARFRLLFSGGPIADEDSFYLMELCSNGSLESTLKRFLQVQSGQRPSLYELLSDRPDSKITVDQAYDQCFLSDDDMILIAYQVACGADYLNRRQIAHCDIAPRNVLVTSRFIMKICDFGLATWTTYKNYREQLAENNSVQLEKKNSDIATHNLTPELARAFLRASTPDERLLLNKSSIKSDVWSFGIFLWTLFLKCRIRPFHKLSQEMERAPSSESFFHQLARMISDGRVLKYIDYQREIPRNIYAIIRECLVEENYRPEMTRIRAYLCHSNILSKRAFEYYRSEYNRYQEENAVDGNVERLAEDQGVRDLPTFDSEYNSLENPNSELYTNVTFRPPITSDLYYAEPEEENPQVPPPSVSNGKKFRWNGRVRTKDRTRPFSRDFFPLETLPPPIPSRASKGGKTPPPPPPPTKPKRPAPIKPPRPKDDPKDSYV